MALEQVILFLANYLPHWFCLAGVLECNGNILKVTMLSNSTINSTNMLVPLFNSTHPHLVRGFEVPENGLNRRHLGHSRKANPPITVNYTRPQAFHHATRYFWRSEETYPLPSDTCLLPMKLYIQNHSSLSSININWIRTDQSTNITQTATICTEKSEITIKHFSVVAFSL